MGFIIIYYKITIIKYKIDNLRITLNLIINLIIKMLLSAQSRNI